jgi:chemotaxis protein MotA
MGLVHMLANLEDSSKIGGAIAVAFLATFWGILSANLIFLPIAERIRARDEEILGTRQAMIQGIMGIQAGEPVRIIEEKMRVYLTSEQAREFTERLTLSGGGRKG